jgi:hypothetical protein
MGWGGRSSRLAGKGDTERARFAGLAGTANPPDEVEDEDEDEEDDDKEEDDRDDEEEAEEEGTVGEKRERRTGDSKPNVTGEVGDVRVEATRRGEEDNAEDEEEEEEETDEDERIVNCTGEFRIGESVATGVGTREAINEEEDEDEDEDEEEVVDKSEIVRAEGI